MARKITKKERKLLNPSTQYANSINNGVEHTIGGDTYFGKLPEFQFDGHRMFKTAKGVPFVKVHQVTQPA